MSENKEEHKNDAAYGFVWIVVIGLLSILDYYFNEAFCLNWVIGLWWSCVTFAHLPYTVAGAFSKKGRQF